MLKTEITTEAERERLSPKISIEELGPETEKAAQSRVTQAETEMLKEETSGGQEHGEGWGGGRGQGLAGTCFLLGQP